MWEENTWQPWPVNSSFHCIGFGIPEVTTSKLVGDDQNVTTPTPPKFDIDTDQMLQMLKGNTFYDGARCFCWAVTLQISEVTNHKKGATIPDTFFWARLTRMNRQNKVLVTDPKVHLGM